MTGIDSARAAADNAKESMRHATEAVAPYAENARDTASHYAHEAGAWVGPRVSSAARQARNTARDNYDVHVVPRIVQARGSLPPEVDNAADRAAKRARKAARQAGGYARPRVESALADARAVAGPAGREAADRSAAAVAALRNDVTARDIEKLARRRVRRARAGKVAMGLGLAGLLAGGAYAAWRWWDKQAHPDWLVEPPPATEVGDYASTDNGATEHRAVWESESEKEQGEEPR